VDLRVDLGDAGLEGAHDLGGDTSWRASFLLHAGDGQSGEFHARYSMTLARTKSWLAERARLARASWAGEPSARDVIAEDVEDGRWRGRSGSTPLTSTCSSFST